MSKTTKNSKKTILTEDLFNANGSTTVDVQVLNENKSDDNDVEGNKETDVVDTQEQIDEIKNINEESIVDSQTETNEMHDDNNVEDNKDNVDIKTESVIKNSQINSKINVKKTIVKNKKRRKNGFNDESYYLD